MLSSQTRHFRIFGENVFFILQFTLPKSKKRQTPSFSKTEFLILIGNGVDICLLLVFNFKLKFEQLRDSRSAKNDAMKSHFPDNNNFI